MVPLDRRLRALADRIERGGSYRRAADQLIADLHAAGATVLADDLVHALGRRGHAPNLSAVRRIAADAAALIPNLT